MKKLLIITFIFTGFIKAQAIDLEALSELESVLEGVSGSGSISRPLNDKKEDFQTQTQLAYSNVVKQLTDVGEQAEEDMIFGLLQKTRMELAINLCQQDQRACFLIEEYRNSFKERDNNSLANQETLFGTDLFSGYSIRDSLVEELPVGSDYIIQIGDVLGVIITGPLTIDGLYKVSPSGAINIESVGSFPVAGQTVSEANQSFGKYVKDKTLGSEAFLFTQRLSANRIFALGAVRESNAFTLNARGSIINLIIAAGGFKENASLRTISINRVDDTQIEIDLYDLLINGRSLKDINLLSGDNVFVKAAEKVVKVAGEVNRPSKYEIKDGENINDLLKFALGFTPSASREKVILKRLNSQGRYEVSEITDFSMSVKNGDEITILAGVGETINFVELIGEIRSPGLRSYKSGDMLNEIIDIKNDLLSSTYTGIGIIERYNPKTRTYSPATFSLLNQDYLGQVKLNSGDKIYILSKKDIKFLSSEFLKMHFQEDILLTTDSNLANSEIPKNNFQTMFNSSDDSSEWSQSRDNLDFSRLRCLAGLNNFGGDATSRRMEYKVSIFTSDNYMYCPNLLNSNINILPILISYSAPVLGTLNNPGLYPINQDVTSEDLIALAGGIPLLNNEITVEVSSRKFDKVLSSSNIPLVDNIISLNVQQSISNEYIGFVTLVGNFEFPGEYQISESTRLSELYDRAGGIKQSAYTPGGIFTRKSVKEREQDALDKAKRQLTDILTGATTSGVIDKSAQDLALIIELISEIENVQSNGRIVTELHPEKIKNNSEFDILLQPGDIIYMPSRPSSVSILGNVLNPTSVPYQPNFSMKQYIRQTGGMTKNADKKGAYVLLPNGQAFKPGATFNLRDYNKSILPGSTIVVPRDSRPLDGLALTEVLTPILANLSITAASISAISRD